MIIIFLVEWTRRECKLCGWPGKAVEANDRRGQELIHQVNTATCFALSCRVFFYCDDFSDVNIFWFSGPVTSTPGQVKHSKRSLFSSPSGITSASLQHLSVSERYSEMFFSRPHFVPHVIWWYILSFHDSVFGQHLYVYSVGVDNISTHCLFSQVYTRMLVNWALRLYVAQQNIYWWLILIHLFVATRAATTRGAWT